MTNGVAEAAPKLPNAIAVRQEVGSLRRQRIAVSLLCSPRDLGQCLAPGYTNPAQAEASGGGLARRAKLARLSE